MHEYVPDILHVLQKLYPKVQTQLLHRNPFELLIATILSAQCTDRQVNRITPNLFAQFPTPQAFAEADVEKIEHFIHSTGFYRNKAKNIKKCCQKLSDEYGGEVPNSLEALLTLPGVGRKTANVVLGAAFSVPGVVVDTHVKRICYRLGFTRHKDPVKIEFDLMDTLPRQEWNDFCLRLIYLGRSLCTARNPKCVECPLGPFCNHALQTGIKMDTRSRKARHKKKN